MQNTKLISLLQTFDKEELKRFTDYVQSPYFNKREAPVLLLKVLLPLYPTFENLKWEKVFIKAFPEKSKFSETYLRNVLSDLCAMAEDFLGQEFTRSSPVFIGNIVLKLLYKRQFKIAEVYLARFKTSLQKNPDIYPGAYSMWRYYYELKIAFHDMQEHRLLRCEALQDLTTILKNESLHNLLECYSQIYTRQLAYYQYEYDTDFLNRFMDIILPEDFKKEPQIAISYYKLLLQTQHTWQAWYNLYDCLKQNKANLVDVFIFHSNTVLVNFISQQEGRDTEMPSGILEKHFDMLEEISAFLEKNKEPYSGYCFQNIVLTGIALKGVEWAKQYIHDNSPKLPDNVREGLTAYCLARIYFYLGDFTETIAILNAISPFHRLYYFLAKSLMLLAYFEKDDYDAFLTTLDAFKHTLKNHPELAQAYQSPFTNMNAILLKLYKLKNKYSQKNMLKIKELLQNPDLNLSSRKWAVKKLREIEAKHARLIQNEARLSTKLI